MTSTSAPEGLTLVPKGGRRVKRNKLLLGIGLGFITVVIQAILFGLLGVLILFVGQRG